MIVNVVSCRGQHDHVLWPAEYAIRLMTDLKTAFRLLPDIGAFLDSHDFPSAGMLPPHSAIACAEHCWHDVRDNIGSIEFVANVLVDRDRIYSAV